MKTNLIVGCLLCCVLFISCDSEEDSPERVTQADMEAIRSTALTGSWRISYFFDTDKEETSNFEGYAFVFGADGIVTAVKDATEVTGTWSVTDSNSSDDSPDDSDVDFNLNFPSPEMFLDLTDDWDIMEYSQNQIRLIDISGGNGGTDYLTFQKI